MNSKVPARVRARAGAQGVVLDRIDQQLHSIAGRRALTE